MHSFHLGTSRTLLALLIGLPGIASCSPSSGTAMNQLGSGSGSGPGSGASGSLGGDTSGGGNGAGDGLGNGSGSDPGIIVSSGGSGALGGGPDAGCATEVHQGERQPLDMYFLVDQSGSMNEGSPSKWAAVSGALTAFLSDPANDGTGAGIGYFPFTGGGAGGGQCTSGQPGCTCIPFVNICFSGTGGSCTASDYATPDVPIALLPGVAASLKASVQAHGPGGGTPTYGALQGAYQYATSWAKGNPGRKTVLVLATDGDPSGCGANDSVPTIASGLVAPAYAGDPANGVPSIPTFVVGVGSSLTSLNTLANAGGTSQAFIVDTGGDVAKQFADALDKIRGQAASCDFGVPNDGTVDPTKVNVTYAPPGSPTPVSVFNVPAPTACTPQADDWYYTDGQSKVTLCPSTCQKLSQNGGSVQVVLGCPTVPQPGVH